jgi:hypothetical protein
MLTDLPDERLTVVIWHPVFRLDFLIGGDVVFKSLVQVHCMN